MQVLSVPAPSLLDSPLLSCLTAGMTNRYLQRRKSPPSPFNVPAKSLGGNSQADLKSHPGSNLCGFKKTTKVSEHSFFTGTGDG